MARDGSIWSIVVGAGSGSRFGGAKQFISVAGRTVLDWSLTSAASVSDGIVVVLPAQSMDSAVAPIPGRTLTCVAGGATRSESVRNGLAAVPADATVIVVHDAARPLASVHLFARVVLAVRAGADAVIPVVGVTDTIRRVDGMPMDRSQLQAVQTPQAFSAEALRRAHADARDASDDATLVHDIGGSTVVVEGERWNIKITEPGDEIVAHALLEARP